MQTPSSKINILFTAVITVVAWFALILQFYITVLVRANGYTIGHALVFYFSFFTVLTNLLVGVSFTARLLSPSSRAGRFFSGAAAISGIALYIIVVGIVYNTVLRNLVPLEGAAVLANELLHVIVPALVCLHWLFFAPKAALQWNNAFTWLWYPGLYLVYSLIRGAITGEYPYPFINVATIGYPKMFINSAVMLVVFLGIGLLFVGMGKRLKPKR